MPTQLEDPSENRKILREVTTVSRLYHRHIVRYYQAWLEGGAGSADLLESDDDDDDGFSDETDELLSDGEDETQQSDWLFDSRSSAGAFVCLMELQPAFC